MPRKTKIKPYYSKEAIKRFSNPKNFGEMKNPDITGTAGNPRCGDIMNIYIRLKKDKRNKETIKDIKFHTLGCVAAIATSDIVCDLVKGKTLEQASKITYKDVVKKLEYLPNIKVHCSYLAEECLKSAFKNYKKKK